MTASLLLPARISKRDLRAIGAERYHDLHPFHQLLHDGKLNRGQSAGLGVQPVLLSGAHSGERRQLVAAAADAGVAPRVAPAPRSTTTATTRTPAGSRAGSSWPTVSASIGPM